MLTYELAIKDVQIQPSAKARPVRPDERHQRHIRAVKMNREEFAGGFSS
jgi:hypothetical protein